MDKPDTKAVAKSNATVIEQSPAHLLQLAIEKDADLDKLEKLMDLVDRYDQKMAKKSYLQAVANFQSNCPALKHTKKVSFQNKAGRKTEYSYLPLGGIIAILKDALKDCGLSYRWTTEEKERLVSITCVVSHEDGHSESNTMTSVMDDSGSKNTIQQLGSTVTYLKRYTLIGALGVATADTDDDGAAGNVNKLEPKPKELPELTPDHPRWDSAQKAFAAGSVSMDDIQRNYKLSKKNYKQFTT